MTVKTAVESSFVQAKIEFFTVLKKRIELTQTLANTYMDISGRVKAKR